MGQQVIREASVFGRAIMPRLDLIPRIAGPQGRANVVWQTGQKPAVRGSRPIVGGLY
jgi:hypothetical protein